MLTASWLRRTSVQYGVQGRYICRVLIFRTTTQCKDLYNIIHHLVFLFSIMKILHNIPVSITLWAAVLQSTFAVNCNLKPSYPAPIVANGWQAQLVAQGLKSPRSIVFDSKGGLLVVQQGNGIVHLQLTDSGGACFDVAKKTTLINDSSVSGP